jgi:hypothetical protein
MFLAGAKTDRAPFLVLATGPSARLVRSSVTEMFSDPHTLMEGCLESLAVFDLDVLILRPPVKPIAEAIAGGPVGGSYPSLDPIAEAIRRLRTLVEDRTGVVLALPGLRTLARELGRGATVADLDNIAGGLLAVTQALEPPLLDCLTLFETESLNATAADDLGAACAMLWNAARYYSIPSLLIVDRSGAEVASCGASAVAVFEGASPGELEAAGASRVGVPVGLGEDLPACSAGGFYITAGELPADVGVEAVQALTARLRGADTRASFADGRGDG